MAWFTGSVSDAVKLCKERSGVLCIFVRDASNEGLDGYFGESDVKNLSEKPGVVLLRIIQGSNEYEMLNSVYPVTAVPMLQFIDGATGRLLFSVSPKNKDDVVNGMREGIETWNRQRGVPPTAPLVAAAAATPTVVRLAPESQTSQNQPSESTSDSAASQDDLDARIARAHAKAAEIRKRKEKEVEEEQRQKEAQRRQDQKLMAEAERQRKVNEAEQVRKDLAKEKRDDEVYRQKILAQLKQDQEERHRRDAEAKGAAPPSPPAPVQSPVKETPSTSSGIDYTKSKIQFRYETAEGMRTFVGTFEATDPLLEAFEFARKETGLRGEIGFLQMYPRKEFTKQDAKSTLRLLGLVPNGVLIVVPADAAKRGIVAQPSNGFIQNLMANILFLLKLPVQALNYLVALLFPPRRDDSPFAGGDNTRRGPAGVQGNRGNDNLRRRHPSDNATYNGNSTQQM
ncbi:UBX domain-containing protein 4-like [Paramacrobiotus metropolitanus]|uniref:UBX domain-containing protein 4-like n=1 Tax=Paramacrobiotus metropolitanus TaxID=2943436 RepID=UPI0024463F6E|nr:UBX domain-containing protein 4-like [Paramacrobiotus metropolitanus]